MKYVVISGGVVSGLGKGITSSSIGALLQSRGFGVTCVKIDPYLNVDAGLMSPYEHGEVYVLDDGSEVDLDLGNYERFLGIRLTGDHNITTGKVYQRVIADERRGNYLGKTVQMVPHVTNQVCDWLDRVSHLPLKRAATSSTEQKEDEQQVADVCMIELGGTVGDYESMVYLEALRQLKARVGKDNFCLVHVSLVPVVVAVGEQKTKPTQQSVKTLGAMGLTPNMIVCRSTTPLEAACREKIAQFCMLDPRKIISLPDVDSSIYEVPIKLSDAGLDVAILGQLKFIVDSQFDRRESLKPWNALLRTQNMNMKNRVEIVKIAIVGKYTGLADSYLSVTKALKHAGQKMNLAVLFEFVDSETLVRGDNNCVGSAGSVEDLRTTFSGIQGILIPGGFGHRGIEGKIIAANYALEHNIPFLGICLGMQVAVIMLARSIGRGSGDSLPGSSDDDWTDANSTEINEDTNHPVVIFMPESSQQHLGGTLRKGSRACILKPNTIVSALYRKFGDSQNCLDGKSIGDDDAEQKIYERHRHRYEVNPDLVDVLENKLRHLGFVFSGRDERGERMEFLELDPVKHPFFVGCQAHPEFLSRPHHPSPPYLGFVRAAKNHYSFVRADADERDANKMQ